MCALTVGICLGGVIARGRRALNDMTVYGVKTTIPYYPRFVQNQEFLASLDTSCECTRIDCAWTPASQRFIGGRDCQRDCGA